MTEERDTLRAALNMALDYVTGSTGGANRRMPTQTELVTALHEQLDALAASATDEGPRCPTCNSGQYRKPLCSDPWHAASATDESRELDTYRRGWFEGWEAANKANDEAAKTVEQLFPLAASATDEHRPTRAALTSLERREIAEVLEAQGKLPLLNRFLASEHAAFAASATDEPERHPLIPTDEELRAMWEALPPRFAASATDGALPEPFEVREYEERPGAFYIAVGEGRWIVDDEAEARRIVALVRRAASATEEQRELESRIEPTQETVSGRILAHSPLQAEPTYAPLPDIPGDGPLCGCGNRGKHVPNVDCDWPCSEPGIWRCTHEACRPS